jgi:ubiquinone/menaquinone biosynthesis C-methylase UbiE
MAKLTDKMRETKSPGDDARPDSSYILGHSDRELDRLNKQARLIDPITRRFLCAAGIVPGMRVLDVGTGAGDVAFLAAELVGARGEVVGTDRSPAALATARQRADARSLRNVVFREGDPAGMTFDRPFDAIVGRYVLMFQREPAEMLRELVPHARRGGVIFFHEPDWDGVRSFPPAPTYDRCSQWIRKTLRLSGAETEMGTKLFSTFIAAGLPAPSMQLETLVGGVANNADPLHLVADLAETLGNAMERLGVATAAEVGLETLAERMIREATASGSVILGRFEIGAWSHV